MASYRSRFPGGKGSVQLQFLVYAILMHLYAKFMIASQAALIAYDTLLTIGDEAALVWPSGLGLAEVLFYVVRYSMIPELALDLLFFFGDVDQTTCRIIAGCLAISVAIGMFLAQAIVVFRTWALWDGSKLFTAVFILFGVLCVGIGLFLSVKWTANTHFHQMSTDHYQVLLMCMERALYTILACHIVLNLRAVARQPDTTIEPVTTDDVFAFGHEEGA
ncbi:hypothetical protein AURDEDRAFT_166714 [Auricularia subglabra TFB-10046 SS5]|nr:hypothetical protein AURDEDRAFT_166714 [Auricularia subglabra TFB-10046 SS5]